jgi:tetratricopeptide (TPR) repeat protein
MKQFSLLVVVIFAGLWLAACDVLAPPPSPVPVAAGAPDTAETYLARGDQYCALKNYDQAIIDYSLALRLNPDYAEAYNNRGYAYYWNGEAARAIADYTQAIALRPDYAYAYNNRGAAYLASGQPDSAIGDFDRALQLQPDFPQAHTDRGNAYLRKGRLDLALADFYRAGTVQLPLAFIAILGGLLLLGVMIQYRAAKRRFFVKQQSGI